MEMNGAQVGGGEHAKDGEGDEQRLKDGQAFEDEEEGADAEEENAERRSERLAGVVGARARVARNEAVEGDERDGEDSQCERSRGGE